MAHNNTTYLPQGTDVRLTQQPQQFERDRLTWQRYLLFGYWSFVWGIFAPVMPFLRSELGINYSVSGLHFSALAVGPLLAGLNGHRVIQALGTTRTIWTGIGIMVLGIILLMIGSSVYVTVGSALLVGAGGCYTGQAIVASLSDRFGEQRGRAIAELNISSSLFAFFAPVTVAAAISLGLYWKVALGVALLLLATISLFSRVKGTTAPSSANSKAVAAPGRLPISYWCYFALAFFTVAGEWSVAFWSPEFLEKVVHVSRANACAGLSVFVIAMFIGRLVGSRLIASIRTPKFLMLSALTAASGFLLFWLSHNFFTGVVGLAILGLGEANVYPLVLSAAIGAAPGQTAKATARMSLSTGSAILLAPLLLGNLADHLGLFTSHILVAGLFMVAALGAALIWRASQSQEMTVRR